VYALNTFLAKLIPTGVIFKNKAALFNLTYVILSVTRASIHSLDGHGTRETMTHRFYIVDVFAERSYSGNQLAVVVSEEALSEETMQQLAAETNYSETTFVTHEPEDDGGYRVRIFTPAREIAFAGHPILGTAWVLRHHVSPKASDPVRLNLAVGQVPVTFELSVEGDEVAWFLAPPVALGASCAREPFAIALGILPDDIATESPIQQITAGISAMIVPLRSLDALRRSKLDLDAYTPLAAQGFPPLVYLFCRQTHHPQNDLCVRFFFEAHGVREDPATGNGAAFLGTYLLEHGLFGRVDLSLRIEQGYEVRRPSLVMLRARMSGGSREVSVGGRVIPTMRGELL
jgi:trans-2,3-dihydro-3-hydroxyanthranilate isomerase